MNIKIKILLLGMVFSWAVCSGNAQTAIMMQQGVVVSRALSGHVNVGITKVPAKGVYC
jgi:hypothetical protein